MNNQTYSCLEPVDIKFKGVSQLLKESWQIYRSGIGTLLGIMIIPVGFTLFSQILINFLNASTIKYTVLFSFVWGVTFSFSVFLSWLVVPTLIYCVKENIGVKESYKKGLKIFWRFFWVFILLNSIILGGFFLLIIPGFIFVIWFSLSIYILIFEEMGGMDTLFRSKHLVSGRFWGVLRRFLGFGLITCIVIVALIVVFFGPFLFKMTEAQSGQFGQAFGYIFNLIFPPFALIYGLLIFENLRNIKKQIPYQKSSQNRKLKYILPGIPGLLIWTLIVGLTLLAILWGRDEPPYDDSDLWLSKIEIPKEQNAFYPLQKATENIRWSHERWDLIDQILNGEEWDAEYARELINKNEETFNYFNEAVDRPYFQDPVFQNPETIRAGSKLLFRGRLRDIAKLNSIKAIYLFNQGEQEEAFNEAIKIIQMGQVIEDAPRGTLIDYLIGMAIKEIGIKKLRMFLPEANLFQEELKKYIDKLDKFKLNEEGLIRVLKMEYMMLTNSKARIDASLISGENLEELQLPEILSLARETSWSNYFYKPNQTQRIFAEHYGKVLSSAKKDYCGQAGTYYEVELLTSSSWSKRLLTENIVGKIIHDITVISFSGLSDRKCQEDFSVIGTQILFAMKAYKLENGSLPNSLLELVPEYFSEVPKDPFGGKEIRYLPEEKIIYSVGEDLKDSGGSEGEYLGDMPDPTFKIEF